jgi:hypothetical protein
VKTTPSFLYMIIQKQVGLTVACFLLTFASSVVAQVTTLSEALSNAQIRAQIVRSNAQAKRKADAEYLRLHPAEATNALTQHQLELLDITSDQTNRSNYFSQHHSTLELEEMTNTVQLFLTNAAAQSSYFFHKHGGMTESEYASNVVDAMRHAPPPKPWPEPSKKREIFEHCAKVLRSAIDARQIEAACGKLTNQPEAVLLLNTLSKEAMTNLDTFASLLNSPDLDSYVGAGYSVKLLTSTNIFYFLFWPSTSVRQIEKRTPDGQHVLVGVRFYENGKVMYFTVNSPDSWGLGFKDDGAVRNYYGMSKNIWLPEP